MSTPLEELDDAIHRFLEATGKDDRAINGWVLGISTSRIDTSDPESLPLVSGAQYAIGPQTSTTDAAGIVRFLDVVYERAAYQMLNAGAE